MKKTLNAVANHLEGVLLSIIVPVFNESAMLPIFLERVIPILKNLPQPSKTRQGRGLCIRGGGSPDVVPFAAEKHAERI
ncbi:hypothetical protein [Microbulbifer sp. 2205BS26-8]|uniref:hypothetical protein n=1 Tax=Microbulbifer sp. 2205BS26-8 TaxID=3064386 RepID=UPI00273DCFEC|nr:hypothetical protein [Microbulbifer sp. 2205BS26-8]MDP5209026.1 hypothetical protein [Microbulbifer sp. 2205BS26-8]